MSDGENVDHVQQAQTYLTGYVFQKVMKKFGQDAEGTALLLIKNYVVLWDPTKDEVGARIRVCRVTADTGEEVKFIATTLLPLHSHPIEYREVPA